jgi:hypothetical protein
MYAAARGAPRRSRQGCVLDIEEGVMNKSEATNMNRQIETLMHRRNVLLDEAMNVLRDITAVVKASAKASLSDNVSREQKAGTGTICLEEVKAGCRYTTCGDSIFNGVKVILWDGETEDHRWYCSELHAAFALLDSMRSLGIADIVSMVQRSLEGQPMLGFTPDDPAPPELGIHLAAVNGNRSDN